MITDEKFKRTIENIILGQIKHTVHEHPEFFTEIGKERLSSISKRISGDVNAYIRKNLQSCKVGSGD